MYNRNALEQRIMEYIMSAKTKNCNKIINRN